MVSVFAFRVFKVVLCIFGKNKFRRPEYVPLLDDAINSANGCVVCFGEV